MWISYIAFIYFKRYFNMTLPDHNTEKTLICTLLDLKTLINLYVYSTDTLLLNGLVKLMANC